MQEWLMQQLADGFPAFKGATITGSLPVQEELINDLIASLLASPSGEPSPGQAIDLRPFAPFVRKATIRAEAGVVRLDVEIRI